MKKFFKWLLMIVIIFIILNIAFIFYRRSLVEDIDFSPSYSSQEQTTDTTSEVPEETSGGNAEDVQYSYYRVTVSEDRYYTENGELTLDELIGEVSVLSEDYVVEIIDNNASLKAYEALTDRLYDISVPYMEDDGEIHT